MRGKMKFGLILLLAVFVAPACGRGQPPDKTIAVFGQTIRYWDVGAGPVVVLVDAAGLKQERPIPDLNPSSLAGMRALMEAVFYDTSWLSEDALRKVFADKLATHDGYTVHSLVNNPALASQRLDNQLSNIKVPTLVVWGKQDSLLPITAGERYAAGIFGAKLVSFDKCGHVPSTEKTEEFLAAVNGFLGSSASATR